MRRVAGKELSLTRSRQRTFHLEEFDADPYVLDKESYWGGLIRIEKKYKVKALTRTSLNLQLYSTTRWVLGRSEQKLHETIESTGGAMLANLPVDMTIVYSDTNLCIIADPQQKTYQVYMSDWQEGARNPTQKWAQQLRFMLGTVGYRFVGGWWRRTRSRRQNARLLQELQTHQDLLDEESRLIVWQLGAGDNDEEAWESRTDPFVHLSADDRQRLLKAMSVKQVQQAGNEYAIHQSRAELLKMPWLRLRRTHFRRPQAPAPRKTDFRRPEA